MNALTEKQERLLHYLIGYHEEYGHIPSYRTIAAQHMGAASTNAAHDAVLKLVRRGYVEIGAWGVPYNLLVLMDCDRRPIEATVRYRGEPPRETGAEPCVRCCYVKCVCATTPEQDLVAIARICGTSGCGERGMTIVERVQDMAACLGAALAQPPSRAGQGERGALERVRDRIAANRKDAHTRRQNDHERGYMLATEDAVCAIDAELRALPAEPHREDAELLAAAKAALRELWLCRSQSLAVGALEAAIAKAGGT